MPSPSIPPSSIHRGIATPLAQPDLRAGAAGAGPSSASGSPPPVRRGRPPSLQHPGQTDNRNELARILGVTLDALDARLPGLKWVKLGSEYAVMDQGGNKVTLQMGGTIGPANSIPATLIDTDVDQPISPEAAAARNIQRLMTDYAPARVGELLLRTACPVLIDNEFLHLPVVLGENRLRGTVHFTDGSTLHLMRKGDANHYVPAGDRQPPATSASAQRDIVLLDSVSTPQAQEPQAPLPGWDDAPAYDDDDDDSFLFGLSRRNDPLALQMKQEDVVDLPWPEPAGSKRRATGSPEDDGRAHQQRRLPMDALARERWDAYCATREVWLPEWETTKAKPGLNDRQRLLLQAAASSVPAPQADRAATPGADVPDLVRSHRETQFLRVATDIAEVTKRNSISIDRFQNSINALKDPAHRLLVQEMLDRACGDESLRGNRGNSLRNGTETTDIFASLRFLRALAEKAEVGKSAAFLQGVMARHSNDPMQRREALAKELGLHKSIFTSSSILEIIKALTGVDLAWRLVQAAPSSQATVENPFLSTGKGTLFHLRFNALAVAENMQALADFVMKRQNIRGPKDGAATYAKSVGTAMGVMEQLEKRKEDGAAADAYVFEAVLRNAFGAGLGKEVTAWEELGTPPATARADLPDARVLSLSQTTAVRETIMADLGISPAQMSDLCPIIFAVTGISLWTR